MDDLTKHSDRLPYCDCHECAIHERNRLRAELAECKRDAERYRWLREKIENDDFLIARASERCLAAWCGDDPDVYIDAALAAKEE